MVRGALMIGLLLLAACSTPQPFLAGAEHVGPLGWFDYCRRQPEDPSCSYATAQERPDTVSPALVSGP